MLSSHRDRTREIRNDRDRVSGSSLIKNIIINRSIRYRHIYLYLHDPRALYWRKTSRRRSVKPDVRAHTNDSCFFTITPCVVLNRFVGRFSRGTSSLLYFFFFLQSVRRAYRKRANGTTERSVLTGGEKCLRHSMATRPTGDSNQVLTKTIKAKGLKAVFSRVSREYCSRKSDRGKFID